MENAIFLSYSVEKRFENLTWRPLRSLTTLGDLSAANVKKYMMTFRYEVLPNCLNLDTNISDPLVPSILHLGTLSIRNRCKKLLRLF